MTFETLGEATVNVKKLQPDPKNVNRHGPRNLEAIKASLKTFGQPERIIARKSDGMIFSGNGRWEAAQQIGLKTLRVQFVEGSDDECRAFGVASNRTASLSEFDDTELGELLSELKANDPALLEAAGYKDDELQDLLESLEKPAKPKAQRGKKAKAGMHVTCPKCGEHIQLGGSKK